ncbi:uncharacterized protein MAM_03306 [Metarhizium album ARSEF 1941]|uniref:DUF7728 domain-containing protein n=1 Tax=Metarhizium album (strain ARSEF 1941) TaxID=1081103 RepID=A0A0B2WZ54_METAS|nr:uncharacterized protein MAM_03306 [Metarhizium album ARSEF 1941]KHN98844.1 hypothetical protein MAM_03306 [Metarhizium album ARSEF 1941]
MQLSPLAFAVAAAGFVIIPELSEADENIFRALPIDAEPEPWLIPIPAESHQVSVPCKQCEDKTSHLQLNLDVVDHTRLLLNGFEVYPNADPWHGDLVAAVESTNGESTMQRLGYSLAIAPEVMDLDTYMQLLDVELHVIEVGNQFVDGIPVVNVKLFKAPSGEIAIAEVDTTSAEMSGCTSMACTAREAMAEIFKALQGFNPFKDCLGRLRNDTTEAHQNSDPSRPQSDDAADDQPSGGKHRQQWGRFITNIAAHIFLPVLMGITAGVCVALFAMAICSLFFRLTSLARSKREGKLGLGPFSRGKALEKDHEEAIASEKVSLMAEEVEAPPQYEDSKE